MWLVSKRDVHFLLICISVAVSQLSYGSLDMDWMAGAGAVQSGSRVERSIETFGNSDKVEALVCYDVVCSGAGCLYPYIRNITDTSVFTCTTARPDACYILVETGPGGVSMSAGCGVDCEATPITSAPIKNGNYTRPPTVITTTDPGDETKKTTHFFEPRKRRRRDVNTQRKCCYSNHCNHDSPCGQLTCSAGFPTLANILLYMFLTVSFNKV